MFFNNKFNTFFGLNLTLVYTFPMCMAWRFHFPKRNYDFKESFCLASMFVILNGACLVFAAAGNFLEKCYFSQKIFSNVLDFSFNFLYEP